MTIELKTLGVDVSKSSVTVHILTSYPKGGLQSYWQKTRNKSSSLYPVFYSSPNPKKNQQKSAFDFATFVKENQPEIAILEPTGNHYSRLWATILESLGIKILWIGHIELRRYRGGKNLPNKSDAADALAMAAYAHDPEHYTELGVLNQKYFLMHRPQPIDRLRELCQQLEHLNRVQSPIVNYCRQLLAWQFPEVAHVNSRSTKLGNVPPLWGWLAQRSEVSPQAHKQLDKKYQTSIASAYGIKIDPTLRAHADLLCAISLEEQRIEAQLNALLADDCFGAYNHIFAQFGFGLRVRARLLTRIYPFEAFLCDGKPLIEYEVKEVKRTQKERIGGQTIVKRSPGDMKRVKRNRSRDAFKMRLGMGTVLEQSGDAFIEITGGSALCRMSLWQYTLCQVETGRLPKTDIAAAILAAKEDLKAITDNSGKQLLNGKHLQGKLMAKVANLLFSELVKAIAKK